MGAGWIGVNTTRVNTIVKSLVADNKINKLENYYEHHAEPAYEAPGYPRSRFDLLLRAAGRRDCYVEIKNTTLYRDREIQFPDAKTARGKKHLLLLQDAVLKEKRGVILFAVNRPEGNVFRVARDIDPLYHQTLVESSEKGVEVLAIRLLHTADSVLAGEALEISLD